MARAEDEEEWQRSRSAMVTSEMTSAYSRPESVRKKKQQTPRPYTPQHTNLSTNLSVRETGTGEEELDISRYSKHLKQWDTCSVVNYRSAPKIQ